MYQPKIRDELISRLYHLAKAQGIPMTRLVDELLTEGLKQLEDSKETHETLRKIASHKQSTRWLRALSIAKILFEEEGYHTAYLEEIEQCIAQGHTQPQAAEGQARYRKRKGRDV